MTAIIALHEIEGIPYEDMQQLDDLPLEVATSDARLDSTEAMVHRVAVNRRLPRGIVAKLNLHNRFQ